MFACAYDEVEKLSGQLLLDVANCLPCVLKRHYLDYLKQVGLDLNKPRLGSLHKFVMNELIIMTSEYVQTFFKLNEKEKSKNPAPGPLRVRQVSIEIMEQSSNDKCSHKQGHS